MQKRILHHTLVSGLVLSMLGAASASPPGGDPRLLSLVPPGAEIVAGLTWGQQLSYMVLTRTNTADLADLESISGVDPTRVIWCALVVAASGSRGFLSEHSLIVSGHFDFRHIFKAAVQNGAVESEYRGISFLSIPPLKRDEGISNDVRWLAVIDSQIVVFGSVLMVQEELTRYLARSAADVSLIERFSRLRSSDQSWFVLNSAAHRNENIRRTLASLDPVLGQPDHADHELILGIHFGRRVDIEYEETPRSADAEEDQPQILPRLSQSTPPETHQIASRLFGAHDIVLHKVIRLSQREYDEFVAQQQARDQTHVEQRTSQLIRK